MRVIFTSLPATGHFNSIMRFSAEMQALPPIGHAVELLEQLARERVPIPRRGYPSGGMFWFRWNRLVGSYRRLTSTSRSQVGPG